MNSLNMIDNDFQLKETVVDIDFLSPLIEVMVDESAEIQLKVAISPLIIIEKKTDLLSSIYTAADIIELHKNLTCKLTMAQSIFHQANSIFNSKSQDAQNLENLLLGRTDFSINKFSQFMQKKIEREYAVENLKSKYLKLLRQAATITNFRKNIKDYETTYKIDTAVVFEIFEKLIEHINRHK